MCDGDLVLQSSRGLVRAVPRRGMPAFSVSRQVEGRQGVKGGGGQEVGSLDVTLKRGQVAARSPVMEEKCLHHRSGQASHPAGQHACMQLGGCGLLYPHPPPVDGQGCKRRVGELPR
jgi:hypothetical protein